MTIYPAIDIKNGRCVRLTQGRADKETVYSEVPADVARGFREAGSVWVHVVDLDGAFAGEPKNLDTVAAIVACGMKVQVGGGLRTKESVRKVLDLGVSRVVIGTRAAESEAFVSDLVGEFGERIAVGIDAKNGQVAIKGWVATTDMSVEALAKRMDAIGVRTLIHTDVGTDGMLTGPNLSAQETLCRTVRAKVIASGGVSSLNDVSNLRTLAKRCPNLEGAIVGKALYEGRVKLEELLA